MNLKGGIRIIILISYYFAREMTSHTVKYNKLNQRQTAPIIFNTHKTGVSIYFFVD